MGLFICLSQKVAVTSCGQIVFVYLTQSSVIKYCGQSQRQRLKFLIAEKIHRYDWNCCDQTLWLSNEQQPQRLIAASGRMFQP